jgi:hypothetical protein
VSTAWISTEFAYTEMVNGMRIECEKVGLCMWKSKVMMVVLTVGYDAKRHDAPLPPNSLLCPPNLVR